MPRTTPSTSKEGNDDVTAMMTEPGGATALLNRPADSQPWDLADEEFVLDVRPVLSHLAATCSNDCSTDDGCGTSCSNGASACTSESNNQF